MSIVLYSTMLVGCVFGIICLDRQQCACQLTVQAQMQPHTQKRISRSSSRTAEQSSAHTNLCTKIPGLPCSMMILPQHKLMWNALYKCIAPKFHVAIWKKSNFFCLEAKCCRISEGFQEDCGCTRGTEAWQMQLSNNPIKKKTHHSPVALVNFSSTSKRCFHVQNSQFWECRNCCAFF